MRYLHTWVYFAAAALILSVPMPAVADGHAEAGAEVYRRCASCHAVEPDAGRKVGPHLNEIFGRAAGTLEGFRFSRAMIAAGEDGLVWDEETLEAFLKRPRDVVRSSRMSFNGLRSEEDRAELIIFLRTLTAESGIETASLEPVDPELSAEIMDIVGDIAYGEYLASGCVACHQLTGGDSGIPNIIGWPAPAMVTVMHAYKNKDRENTVMQQQAATLSNEEIAALAAYFETLE